MQLSVFPALVLSRRVRLPTLARYGFGIACALEVQWTGLRGLPPLEFRIRAEEEEELATDNGTFATDWADVGAACPFL